MADPKALPDFASLAELVDFFDNHDMGDYWESMPEAQFDVSTNCKQRFVAMKDLGEQEC